MKLLLTTDPRVALYGSKKQIQEVRKGFQNYKEPKELK